MSIRIYPDHHAVVADIDNQACQPGRPVTLSGVERCPTLEWSLGAAKWGDWVEQMLNKIYDAIDGAVSEDDADTTPVDPSRDAIIARLAEIGVEVVDDSGPAASEDGYTYEDATLGWSFAAQVKRASSIAVVNANSDGGHQRYAVGALERVVYRSFNSYAASSAGLGFYVLQGGAFDGATWSDVAEGSPCLPPPLDAVVAVVLAAVGQACHPLLEDDYEASVVTALLAQARASGEDITPDREGTPFQRLLYARVFDLNAFSAWLTGKGLKYMGASIVYGGNSMTEGPQGVDPESLGIGNDKIALEFAGPVLGYEGDPWRLDRVVTDDAGDRVDRGAVTGGLAMDHKFIYEFEYSTVYIDGVETGDANPPSVNSEPRDDRKNIAPFICTLLTISGAIAEIVKRGGDLADATREFIKQRTVSNSPIGVVDRAASVTGKVAGAIADTAGVVPGVGTAVAGAASGVKTASRLARKGVNFIGDML